MNTARPSAAYQLACEPVPPKPAWSLYSDRRRWTMLGVLFLITACSYADRNIMSVLLVPIKHEFHVSDTMLGLLSGLCFAPFLAIAGMPAARWSDSGDRRMIITLAIAIWSVMTMLCGVAQTFWQLALARVGVGAGESGTIPSQALLVDYFPPGRRATALAILTAATSAGNLLGISLGGYLVATHGWRTAIVAVGLPGLLLALISRFTLAEPRSQLGFPGVERTRESVREALRRLSKKASFLYALLASVLFFMFASGVLGFVPLFLVRAEHIPLTEVSVIYGPLTAIGALIGTVGGGGLADRLAKTDVRWLAWLPAAAYLCAGPLYILAFIANGFSTFMVCSVIAYALLSGGLPATFAAIHAVCGNARRSTAVAIVVFIATLLGGGLGPFATGALSDRLSGPFGPQSLRYSLIAMVTLLIASGLICYFFGRAISADLEE